MQLPTDYIPEQVFFDKRTARQCDIRAVTFNFQQPISLSSSVCATIIPHAEFAQSTTHTLSRNVLSASKDVKYLHRRFQNLRTTEMHLKIQFDFGANAAQRSRISEAQFLARSFP